MCFFLKIKSIQVKSSKTMINLLNSYNTFEEFILLITLNCFAMYKLIGVNL